MFRTAVPEGVEPYLYPAHCGVLLVPGQAGVRGNEIADKLARDGSDQRFVGPKPFLGGLLTEYKKEDKTLNGKPAFHIVAWSL